MTDAELKRRYLQGERDFRSQTFVGVELHSQQYANCNFSNATFGTAHTYDVGFIDCNLKRTNWVRTGVRRTWFERCSLDGSTFFKAEIAHSLFNSCSLVNATFGDAVVYDTRMTSSDLQRAQFLGTTFRRTELLHNDFSHAEIGETTFIDSSIHSLAETASVSIEGAVTTDWLTVCRTLTAVGLDDFLLRGGLPEVFTTYMLDCARSMDPKLLFSMMRSTFISYGGPDLAFATRLRNALVRNGVRTFFFATDAIAGAPLHTVMREGVEDHDRVILICSESALDRSGVQNEIMLALSKEARQGGKSYLIPVLLDDFLHRWTPERRDLALALRDRVAADFSGAIHDEVAFDSAVSKLIRALRR